MIAVPSSLGCVVDPTGRGTDLVVAPALRSLLSAARTIFTCLGPTSTGSM
jgi:hypothetical protein